MRLFFPLLLLSLPLLLLLGLSDAAAVEPTNAKESPGKCDNQKEGKIENCTAAEPYCLILFTLKEDQVYDPNAIHDRELKSCTMTSVGEGCVVLQEENQYYCYCDSRKKNRCSRNDEIQDRLLADALAKYQKAHPTTLPPTTNNETHEPKNGEEMDAFPFLPVLGVLVVGGCVAFFIYRKGKLDRQLKKIARSILAIVLNNCDPKVVMGSWNSIGTSCAQKVDGDMLIPEKFAKKVLGEGHLAMVAATAVDTKLPGEKQMPWNFVDDEHRLIAAQCPLKSYLGEFFLSLVYADVKCMVQLTQSGEKMGDGSPTDYLPLGKGSLEQMKVGDATIDVRISAVQDKKSYARRKLHIKVKAGEAGKSGTFVVDHFHYHNWAEDVIPAERTDIFDVVFMVFKASTYAKKRLLVHCRDGIGRTGAFLLAQILLKEAFIKKKELTTESVLQLAKFVRCHRAKAITEPTQLSFALFIVAGVVMKAADATMEEAQLLKKFNDSLGDQITSEAKERAKAKEAGKKAATEKEKKEKEAGGGGGEKGDGGGNV